MLSILMRALLTTGSPPVELISYALSSTSGTGNTLAIPAPAGIRADDLLIGGMGRGAALTGTWTGDTGWVEEAISPTSGVLRIASKVATGSEPGSYSFGFSSSISPLAGQILALRNAEIDAIGTFGSSIGTSSLVMPSITMSKPGMLLAFAFTPGAPRTHAAPAGMTATATKINSDAIITAFFEKVPSGATGSRTSVMTGSGSSSNSGILIGVRQA